MDCIFCNIIRQEIPAKIHYEDEHLIIIDDISPKAPIHRLLIPKQHIPTLNALNTETYPLMGKLYEQAVHIAHSLNISEEGYRLIMNCNPHGGQTVYHIHLHLMGGRFFTWPPG